MAEAKYLRIANSIREEIRRGRWRVGEYLPSTAQLQVLYAPVGKETIRTACVILAAERLIEGDSTVGRKVIAVPPPEGPAQPGG